MPISRHRTHRQPPITKRILKIPDRIPGIPRARRQIPKPPPESPARIPNIPPGIPATACVDLEFPASIPEIPRRRNEAERLRLHDECMRWRFGSV
jgi:hypothetical protein